MTDRVLCSGRQFSECLIVTVWNEDRVISEATVSTGLIDDHSFDDAGKCSQQHACLSAPAPERNGNRATLCSLQQLASSSCSFSMFWRSVASSRRRNGLKRCPARHPQRVDFEPGIVGHYDELTDEAGSPSALLSLLRECLSRFGNVGESGWHQVKRHLEIVSQQFAKLVCLMRISHILHNPKTKGVLN